MYKLTSIALVISILSLIPGIVHAQSCSSTRDYETGLKNGLKMAPPCDLTSAKLPRCNGEYNTLTWSNCYGERTTQNGSTYRGGYLEGKANGKGEFVNPDGTRYLGDYDKGQRNGYGKEYAANGLVLNEGQWNNGILVSNAQKAQSSQSQQTTNVSTSYRCQKEDLLVIIDGLIKQNSPQQNGWERYEPNAQNFLKVTTKDRTSFAVTDFAGDKPSTDNYQVIGSKSDLQGPLNLILRDQIKSTAIVKGIPSSFYIPFNFSNLNNFIFYLSLDKGNMSIKTKGVCYKE